jgi:hypothetical protein
MEDRLARAMAMDAAQQGGMSPEDKAKLDGIAAGAEVNVQSDWNEADSTADDFIKNKPTLGTAAQKNVPLSGNAGNSEIVLGDDTRLSDSRTPTAHSHTKSDITDFPTLGTILTGTASGSNNTWVTTRISFTVPAGKKAIFIATLFYNNTLPAGIKIGISSDPTDETLSGKLWNTSNSGDDNYLSVSGVCNSRSSDTTYYCSVKNSNSSVSNNVALWYAII